MKRLFKTIWQFLTRFSSIKDCYYATLPFGTAIAYAKSLRRQQLDFDTLVTLTDTNDDAYKKLAHLQFKIDDVHKELRMTIDRAKICPTAIDKDTVELDATIWLNEQMLDMQHQFAAFGLDERLVASAFYEQQADMILCTLQSVETDIQADMLRFMSVNRLCTVLWLACVALVLFIILL